jgi:hypothetical protein
MSGLYVDPSIPRYTRGELVREMNERFGFSDGAFRKYQQLGLVAAPHADHRWAEGRPGSELGLWSDHDRHMLMAVLDLRKRQRQEREGQLELSGLGNFVVWSWAYFDGYVRIDQVRRAARTWVAPQLGGQQGKARSRSRMSQLGRQVVDRVAAPNTRLRDRKSMAQKLSDKLWANDLQGLLGLADDLKMIIDPDGTGRRVGIGEYSADAATQIKGLYMKHLGAQAVLAATPALTDDDWLKARRLMQESWAGYRVDQPELAAMSGDQPLFTEPTISYQLSESTSTLLFSLGAILCQKSSL